MGILKGTVMKKKISLLLVLSLLLTLLTSCGKAEREEKMVEKEAEKLLSEMTEEEKFGQVILMDFRNWLTPDELDAVLREEEALLASGVSEDELPAREMPDVTELNDEIAATLADYRLGNIILFGENCTDTASLARLTYDLQHTALDAGLLPLLIGADQEGGNVVRLTSGCWMTGNMALGASGKTENARLTGQVLGSELKAVGINCDFAPVADVNSNPANPVIGLRSFSDDPNVTAEMASAMAEGLLSENVIPCAKHFPGHGNTDTDSHTGLPLVECSYEDWLALDAIPFQALAEQNIPMIMSAHIQYPGLDSTKVVSKESGEDIYLPATLSHTILTDILKGTLGFEGVIVTDALNMDAITANFGEYDAAIMALAAGADLLCMPVIIRSTEDSAKLAALYDAFRSALQNGTLTEERLNDAVLRVLKMKLRAGLFDKDYDYSVDAAVENALAVVGGEEHRATERQIARQSVRLQYSGEFTPFAPSEDSKTLVLMPYDNEVPSVRYALNRMLSEGQSVPGNVEILSYQGAEELSEEMQNAIREADYLIVGSEQYASTLTNEEHWLNARVKDILSLTETDKIAILCLALPYQADKFSEDYPAFVLCNYIGMSDTDAQNGTITEKYGPMIPAGIEAIFGR